MDICHIEPFSDVTCFVSAIGSLEHQALKAIEATIAIEARKAFEVANVTEAIEATRVFWYELKHSHPLVAVS